MSVSTTSSSLESQSVYSEAPKQNCTWIEAPWLHVHGDECHHTLGKVILVALVLILTLGFALIPMFIRLASLKKSEILSVATTPSSSTSEHSVKHSSSTEFGEEEAKTDERPVPEFNPAMVRFLSDKEYPDLPYEANEAFWKEVAYNLKDDPQNPLMYRLSRLTGVYATIRNPNERSQCMAKDFHVQSMRTLCLNGLRSGITSADDLIGIPPEILEFTSLESLHILDCNELLFHINSFNYFPKLTSLKKLVISGKEIDLSSKDFTLPAWIEKIPNLESLVLLGSNLKVPLSLHDKRNLKITRQESFAQPDSRYTFNTHR